MRARYTFISSIHILALVTLVPREVQAAGAAPGKPTPQAQVVSQQEDAYNAKNLEPFLATYADNAVLTDLLTGKELASGKDALRARYAVRFNQSPDQRATILQRIAVGAIVVDRESLVWKKDAPSVESLVIYLVQNSKIARVWFASLDAKTIQPAPGAVETVNEIITTTNAHGLNRTIELYDPRLEIRNLAFNSTALRGVTELRAELRESFDTNPLFSVELVDSIAAGPFVVAQVRLRGDARRGNSDDVVIYEIFGGKVRRMWVTPVSSSP